MSSSGDKEASGPESEEMLIPGTTLLKCEPFVYSSYLSKSSNTQLCDTCLTIKEGLLRCTSCRMVLYCNKNCQKKGWKDGHKYECKHMSWLLESPLEKNKIWAARILLRLIVKLQDGKDYYDILEIGGSEVKRRFKDLMSHCEELREDAERLEGVKLLLGLPKAMLSSNPEIKIPTDTELIEMYGKGNTNAFVIEDLRSNKVGGGVYLGGSIFNHSCSPMATRIFVGPTMYIRNLVEIPKSLPIDQVTVAYMSQLLPSPERRDLLLRTYYFHCECERCRIGQFDREMRSITCPGGGCDAKIDTTELKNPCRGCGYVMKQEMISEILETEYYALRLVKDEEIVKSFLGFVGGGNLGLVESCIQKMKTMNFSDAHWVMLELFEKAYQESAKTIFGKPFDTEKAYEYGSKYIMGIRNYVHPYNKELMQMLIEVAWFAFLLDKFDEAEKYIVEAKSIAVVLYDENCEFIRTRMDVPFERIRRMKTVRGMQQQLLA